ncbi:MAG: hypothetical protein EOP56_13190 [Sphingobacteriales bacterium]|nr:MAG: hypothetical protein EOP56_13190 [Sphingobacteriales bacterium]
MDVAKYIGLFLLKNNFCYIHGLGNLELRKKSASYDGQALQAPTYEVVVSSAGSIDDNLANFIATAEQISISKASNALRDFSTQSRAALAEGKDVIIPAVGKFVEHNGKIAFVTDPHMQYTPPSVPVIKSATRSTVTPKETSTVSSTTYNYQPDDEAKSGSINWGKIIIVIVLAILVIAAIIFGMNYMQPKPAEPAEPEPIDTVQQVQQVPVTADTTMQLADTLATAPDATATGTIQQNGSMLQFSVVLKTYTDSAKAAKRTTQLNSYGNKVSMVPAGNGSYHVVMPVSAMAADTTRVLDSLKRTFNPSEGVRVLR